MVKATVVVRGLKWLGFILAGLLVLGQSSRGFAQTDEEKVVLKLKDADIRDAVKLLFELRRGQFGYDLSQVETALTSSNMGAGGAGGAGMPGAMGAPAAGPGVMAAPMAPGAMPGAGAPGGVPGGTVGTDTSTNQNAVKQLITLDIPEPGIEWEKAVNKIAEEANLKPPRREGTVYKFIPKPPPPSATGGAMTPGAPGMMGPEAGMMPPGAPGAAGAPAGKGKRKR